MPPHSLPDDLNWRLLETMLTIRRFEEAVLHMSVEGQFRGHYHLYIGQEATGAAVMSVLEPRDRITTTHRNHGHVLARGADPGRAMAEILGRASGLNGGRGGTIHLSDPDLGFLSTSGIVGGCISLGVGGGYACKRKRDGSIAASFFGDGALEEGVSFEALNIASLWKLPVLFLCENNSSGSWAPGEGYPTLVHASSDLCSIPQSVGISTMRVDGADVAAVHAAATDAVWRCRRGEGPVFIEAMTKRWPGNNPLWPELVTGVTDVRMATDERSTEGEYRDWFENHDPVLRFARTLAIGGSAAKTRLRALDAQTRARIETAVRFALESPLPSAESAFERVFA
jgi:TPP-dependent pyruvate/acetoin dehydrogenase alpha subunit